VRNIIRPMRARLRRNIALIAVTLLAAASVGWTAWIVADPQLWLPGYERGPTGPKGDRGPAGPVGEAGPDVSADISAHDEALSLLSDELDDAQARLDEVESTLEGLCSAIQLAWAGANSSTEEMLFQLQLECP
jgi:hypothetical protein